MLFFHRTKKGMRLLMGKLEHYTVIHANKKFPK